MSNLQTLIDGYNVAKKKFHEEGSKLLMNEIITEAKKIPNLISIRWHQYTPYFNDGDACTFRVNNPYFKFSDLSDKEGDYGDGYLSRYDLKNHANFQSIQAIDDLITDSAVEEILENTFEDHVQVTVNVATGEAATEEFEHD